jgi:hypothetical protein
MGTLMGCLLGFVGFHTSVPKLDGRPHGDVPHGGVFKKSAADGR